MSRDLVADLLRGTIDITRDEDMFLIDWVSGERSFNLVFRNDLITMMAFPYLLGFETFQVRVPELITSALLTRSDIPGMNIDLIREITKAAPSAAHYPDHIDILWETETHCLLLHFHDGQVRIGVASDEPGQAVEAFDVDLADLITAARMFALPGR